MDKGGAIRKFGPGHWLALGAFLLCVLLASRLIGPRVSRQVTLLTGPVGSTLHDDGLRYQDALREHGIRVELVETAGSYENLQLLGRAGGPTAALADAIRVSAPARENAPESVRSLGSMYLSPLWIFSPRDEDVDDLGDLRGGRIAPGQQGSGARELSLFLLRAVGLEGDVELVAAQVSSADEAVEELQSQEVVALLASGAPESELVDRLLREPGLQLLSIPRIEAIAVRYPFLTRVRFPEGVHDLQADIPDRDTELLASGTELLVTEAFPPALSDLLLEASGRIFGEGTIFTQRGDFPDPRMTSVPLSRAAKRYYEEGPPALMGYLPFRLATMVDRFLLMAAAIASAAAAIFGLAPRLIALPYRLATARAYRSLEVLEREVADGADLPPVLKELDEIDRATSTIKVPLRSLRASWFELRQNVHDMRDRLESR